MARDQILDERRIASQRIHGGGTRLEFGLDVHRQEQPTEERGEAVRAVVPGLRMLALGGGASAATAEDPAAFERANYVRTMRSWTTPPQLTSTSPRA